LTALLHATPAEPLNPAHPNIVEHISFLAMGGKHEMIVTANSQHYQAQSKWLHSLRTSASQSRSPMSVNQVYNGSGQAGFVYGQSFDDIYGTVVAWAPGLVYLPAAPPGSGSSIQDGNVVANTFHAGLNVGDNTTGCIEGGSVYTDNDVFPGTTAADFYFGDLCTYPGSVSIDAIPMDSNFQSRFVRDLGDGIPEVTVEIYQPVGDPQRAWHGALYDYSASGWADEMITIGNLTPSNPNYGFAQYGYALFETHLYPGPCPSLPTMEEKNIQLAVEPGIDSQNYFRLAQSSDAIGSPGNPTGAACLTNDASGQGAVYNWSATSYSNAWVATDPHPMPSNTPNPRPTPPNHCGTRICYAPVRPIPTPTAAIPNP
jgi:hypothetical protein